MSPAVTNADPVLTRFALGRSNDGSQFGMALQVFADGTVIDSEGVHHLRAVDFGPSLKLCNRASFTACAATAAHPRPISLNMFTL